jgi:hypothetical protein
VRDESCQALRAAGGQEAHLNYRGLSLSCVCVGRILESLRYLIKIYREKREREPLPSFGPDLLDSDISTHDRSFNVVLLSPLHLIFISILIWLAFPLLILLFSLVPSAEYHEMIGRNGGTLGENFMCRPHLDGIGDKFRNERETIIFLSFPVWVWPQQSS